MTNSYYNRTFDVMPGNRIGSQRIEDELTNVQTGFDRVARDVGALGGPNARIAILSDSCSAQDALWSERWPSILERTLNQNGANVQVRTFAINADSFYRMNTVASFGTMTSVQAVIDYAPDIVLVVAGFNDAVDSVDGRTLAQVKADAALTFTTLRAGLPTAALFYGAQVAYDTANFTPATLKNKGVMPQLWTLPAAGIYTNCWTEAGLETDCATATRDGYDDWVELDTYIKALTTVDGSMDLDGWRIARLGLVTSDGLHGGHLAHTLLSGYALKGLLALPEFTALVPIVADQIIAEWIDPDAFFEEFLTDSGTGWVYSLPAIGAGDAGATETSWGPQRWVRTENWYHPYKGSFQVKAVAASGQLDNDSSVRGMFAWFLNGGQPNVAVEISVDGGAFFSPGYNTDDLGNAHEFGFAGPIGASNGVHTIAFRFGRSVYGPENITIVAPTSRENTAPILTDRSADYTMVLADANNQQHHPVADANNRTFTIPANSSVAYPIGTRLYFSNGSPLNPLSIAITSDTMYLAGSLTTGTRSLIGQNGVAIAQKVTATTWIISGSGLT